MQKTLGSQAEPAGIRIQRCGSSQGTDRGSALCPGGWCAQGRELQITQSVFCTERPELPVMLVGNRSLEGPFCTTVGSREEYFINSARASQTHSSLRSTVIGGLFLSLLALFGYKRKPARATF